MKPTDTVQQAPPGIRGPVFNPSPKMRFRQESGNIARHHALLEQASLDQSLDFSLLEYWSQAAMRVNDTNSALAFGYKMIGVQEFLTVFRTLAEQPQIPRLTVQDNLQHKS